ncbi:tyrosine-type recombinase/integrase [Sansalvadorimonas verongulae]|uniref:tyrosine-type recombinase/integrase n=1 Tax=Sansalvadorimonas verongulae TaxID=2172824 RepID=UPI0012BC3F1D|nr:tyrosine-type recombinase/integrase [Sansalvadorimonas verongulae]MTI13193.1 site-specific integrase [Sansalvadorimonas verongulae]
MATFVKTKTNQWKAIVRKNGVFKSKTFKRKPQAQQWAGDIEESIVDAQKAILPTFIDILSQYIEHVNHKLGEASYIRRLKPSLELHCLDTLTPLHLDRIRDERLKKLSGTTVRKDLLFISRVYTFAINKLRIDVKNPVRLVSLPKENKPRNRIASMNEQRLILDNVSDKMRPIFILAIETAMRRSEILSIKWEYVDIGRRKLELYDTKNGESREVPLNSRAIDTIRNLGVRTHGKIFSVSKDGVTGAMQRACIRTGIIDLRFHDLRHTAITKYALKGMSVAQLKVISGHKCLSQLSRYVNLKASDVVGLMD